MHFLTGQIDEARDMVVHYHYSRHHPANCQFVGSLHEDGGLFGDQVPMIAACFFSIPATRWSEPVIELSRLVRRDDVKPPLSRLISLCCKELKKRDFDLIVSYADSGEGHVGYIYQACSWRFHVKRKPTKDGFFFNEEKIRNRSVSSLFGTKSLPRLQAMLAHYDITRSWDSGKYLYWKALNKKGLRKAQRLGLESNPYPKDLPC